MAKVLKLKNKNYLDSSSIGEINWMEKSDIIKLQEVEDRSKSNTKRLD